MKNWGGGGGGISITFYKLLSSYGIFSAPIIISLIDFSIFYVRSSFFNSQMYSCDYYLAAAAVDAQFASFFWDYTFLGSKINNKTIATYLGNSLWYNTIKRLYIS